MSSFFFSPKFSLLCVCFVSSDSPWPFEFRPDDSAGTSFLALHSLRGLSPSYFCCSSPSPFYETHVYCQVTSDLILSTTVRAESRASLLFFFIDFGFRSDLFPEAGLTSLWPPFPLKLVYPPLFLI